MSWSRVRDASVIVNGEGKYLNIPFEKMERHIWVENVLDAQIFHNIAAGFTAMKIEPAPTIQSLEDAMIDHFKRKGK